VLLTIDREQDNIEMPLLKYPEMRMELLGYLRKLKDLKYQMKAWVNHDFPADVQYDHLDLAIHFIFDDTDLGSDARMAIGEILLDEQEAGLMRQLVDAINAVFEAYGTDMPNSFYMQVGEWTRVVAYAERAFDCLEGSNAAGCPEPLD